MKRALATAIGICLTWALFLGASGDVGISSSLPQKVGMSNDLASAMGGSYSGDASWDTLTYIFTFAPDTTTNAHSEFTAAIRNADLVVDLSDPANGFAFCMVDSALPNSRIAAVDGNAWIRTSQIASASTTDRWKLDSTSRRNELIYIPFEDFIPAGSQIVTACEKRMASTTNYIGAADSLAATLLTIPADSLWYKSVGVTSPSGQTRYAHATWRYQVSGLGVDGYPAANGGAWTPEFQLRDRIWDFGDYSDLSGRPNGSSTTRFTEVDASLLNCVQAAVNGAVNNGIILTYSDWSSSAATAYWYSWEATGVGVPYRPWIEVKFLTKKYVAPWPGGKDWAFIAQTDDGRYKVNKMFADTFATHPGKFTMYLVGAAIDSAATDASYYSITDAVDAYNTGHAEIGSHSYHHNPVVGLTKYNALIDDTSEFSIGMYPATLTSAATAWDSLMWDADPHWLVYKAAQAGLGDLSNRPLFAQSMGLPAANHSPDSQIALSRLGYKSVRTLGVQKNLYDANNNLVWRRTASFAPGRADTTYSGFKMADVLGPRNVRFFADSIGLDDILGSAATNPSMAEVEYNTRNAIAMARASGRRVLAFLIHDVKTGQDGTYPNGIDPDELGQMLAVTRDKNGAVLSVTEAVNWLVANSTAIATPSAFAQPDSFKYTIADDVWGVLYGMDGTFIPGLK